MLYSVWDNVRNRKYGSVITGERTRLTDVQMWHLDRMSRLDGGHSMMQQSRTKSIKTGAQEVHEEVENMRRLVQERDASQQGES